MKALDTSELLLARGIENSLQYCLYSNAIFLAERLFALRKCEETAYLLAIACIRHNKVQRASAVLAGYQSPENRYLAAWCFFEQNKLREAEESLRWNEKEEEIPGKAAGHYLLGLVYQRSNRKNKAVDQFKKSLEKDPTMWMAYVALCDLGSCPDPDVYFSKDESTVLSMQEQASEDAGVQQSSATTSQGGLSCLIAPMETTTCYSERQRPPQIVGRTTQEEEYVTPYHTPKRLSSPFSRSSRIASMSNPPLQSNNALPKSGDFRTPSPEAKKSNVLPPSVRRNNKPLSTPHEPMGSLRKLGRLSFSSRSSDRVEQQVVSATEKSTHDNFSVMKLLRTLGKAQLMLSLFYCDAAIQALESLPPAQYQTGYVLSMVGRAYYEMLDYTSALQAFEQCQHLDFTYTDGLEYFSSIMWHLRMETELSFLSQYLLSVDRNSSAAWCAMGNLFSLQKDPETAIRCLKRAVLLAPRLSYAHSLIGHEYILKEDYDTAMACFRTALAINEREYHAWYGLGQVFHKQEKYKLADYHYRCAIKINPRSSLLYYHLANVCDACKSYNDALEAYDKAIELNAKNYVARFERARLYAKIHRHKDATEELIELSNLVPKEPAVHYLLGKLAKQSGDRKLAMQYFMFALDLDPKSRLYKHCLENIDSPDDAEDL
jgi:anaphase-promoting complex subunit 3